MATTVDNSGLAAILADGFAAECGCRLDMLVTGSAQALAIVARGDAPAAITHAPGLEADFIAANPGNTRQPFMASEFVLAGPADDPAGARGLDLAAAFKAVAASQTGFITRADGSGTNVAELEIWRQAKLAPGAGDGWYIAGGLGMGQTLLVAEQIGAYTLSDTATLAQLQGAGAVELELLARDRPGRANIYSLVVAAPADGLAARLAGWLAGPDARRLIAGYRSGGQTLFTAHP